MRARSRAARLDPGARRCQPKNMPGTTQQTIGLVSPGGLALVLRHLLISPFVSACFYNPTATSGGASSSGSDITTGTSTTELPSTSAGSGVSTTGTSASTGSDPTTSGFDSTTSGPPTRPTCGDGMVDRGEVCDDGDDIDDNGCTNACTIAGCGNGILEPRLGEECDFGEQNEEDGACTPICKYPTCGDGFKQPSKAEECDNGIDNTDISECTATCKQNVCGDGLVWDGQEMCDDGPENGDNAACTTACTLQMCGDGFVGPGEQCDDGNPDPGDGCDANCKFTCGNNVIDPGEECDDGDLDPSDDCTSECSIATCGDGFVNFNTEDCDTALPLPNGAEKCAGCSVICKSGFHNCGMFPTQCCPD